MRQVRPIIHFRYKESDWHQLHVHLFMIISSLLKKAVTQSNKGHLKKF